MNQGIKSYSKFIEDNMGQAGSTLINLNNHYNDFFIKIPFYTSNLSFGIDLEMIFSYKNSNLVSEFGKGYRINFYKKIHTLITDENNESEVIRILIENYDFSIDIYERYYDENLDDNERKYVNYENNTYIISYTADTTTYKLYDENGNYLILGNLNENYPKSIYKKMINYLMIKKLI